MNMRVEVTHILSKLNEEGLFKNGYGIPKFEAYLVFVNKNAESYSCTIKNFTHTVSSFDCAHEDFDKILQKKIKEISKFNKGYCRKINEDENECIIFACAWTDDFFKHRVPTDIFLDFLKHIYSIYLKTESLDFSAIDSFRKYVNEFFFKRHGFYLNVFDRIASMPNEKRGCYGKIYFTQNSDKIEKDNTFIDLNLSQLSVLSYPSAVNIRKLLELTTTENLFLLIEGVKVTGIFQKNENNIDDLNVVKFEGFGNWTWSIIKEGKEVEVLSSKGGAYLFPPMVDYKDAHKTKIKETLQCITFDLDILFNKYKHGALLILSDEAKINAEIERLHEKARCIPISETSATTELLSSFSNIDGAILIDTNGKIRAIGAILDGEAKAIAKISRGARYNSAANYIANVTSKENPLVAIVISEDETIDVLS